MWNEEIAKHGKEKASVTRAIIRMIWRRLLAAALIMLLFSSTAVLGPVGSFSVLVCAEVICNCSSTHSRN